MAANPPAPILVPGAGPPADGTAVRILAAGKPVAVFNRGGNLYAISAICPHMGGPLDKGAVSGVQVRCPLHGSTFDIETGQVVLGPARAAVRAYRVRAEPGGLVLEPL